MKEVVGVLAGSAAPSASLRFGTSPVEDDGGGRFWFEHEDPTLLPPPGLRGEEGGGQRTLRTGLDPLFSSECSLSRAAKRTK